MSHQHMFLQALGALDADSSPREEAPAPRNTKIKFGDCFESRADYTQGTFYSGRRKFHVEDDGRTNTLQPLEEFMTRTQVRKLRKENKCGSVKRLHFSSTVNSEDAKTAKVALARRQETQNRKKNARTPNIVTVEKYTSLDPADWVEQHQAGCRFFVNPSSGEVSSEAPWLLASQDDSAVGIAGEEGIKGSQARNKTRIARVASAPPTRRPMELNASVNVSISSPSPGKQMFSPGRALSRFPSASSNFPATPLINTANYLNRSSIRSRSLAGSMQGNNANCGSPLLSPTSAAVRTAAKVMLRSSSGPNNNSVVAEGDKNTLATNRRSLHEEQGNSQGHADQQQSSHNPGPISNRNVKSHTAAAAAVPAEDRPSILNISNIAPHERDREHDPDCSINASRLELQLQGLGLDDADCKDEAAFGRAPLDCRSPEERVAPDEEDDGYISETNSSLDGLGTGADVYDPSELRSFLAMLDGEYAGKKKT